MKPKKRSQLLLGVTRSKAKMYEYKIPQEHHITITQDPAKLFTLSIGLLGELSARTNSEDIDGKYLDELRKNLQFSARFFDAYLQTKLNEDLNPYTLLLGAASYYLCDLPGSSIILAEKIGDECPNLDCMGLEELLLWLLKGDFSTYYEGSTGPFGKYIDTITWLLAQYYENGTGEEQLFTYSKRLRKNAYDIGTPRQLLLADVISAVIQKRYNNSSLYCLPNFTDLPKNELFDVIQKDTFIRELWPSQRLLGEQGVFKGKSAIVQMPTSAGKTKATEIIIRTSFLSRRTSLAIIVAPFRALCHEIKNSYIKAFKDEPINIDELSDVLQEDFDIDQLLNRKQILVVTPEKLIYVLRHAPELIDNIGLLIFDEGHQFDSGTRGITYELLLTSLIKLVHEGTQKVLISAVISNADAVGNWLNGTDSVVVSGINLIPTYRSIAFSSWIDNQGKELAIGWIRYINPNDSDDYEFFVPRVIERQALKRRKEGFPSKKEADRGKELALYIGLKLASDGGVAIFCGRKDTASGLCETAVKAHKGGLVLSMPYEFSNKAEIEKLYYLHKSNLGENAISTQSAGLGVFAHHGNVPHGIRLAIEYSMKEGLIGFVICTSTLAQGVNLPIRYLIVTSVYQGTERIKVRDFHNLIGRAGRAGMHTEGSIIFADPVIYDKRNSRNDKWRWAQVVNLLEPGNSEPCASSLLTFFEPFYSEDRESSVQLEPLEFVNRYINTPDRLLDIDYIVSKHSNLGFTKTGLENQLAWKLNIVSAIESFLMSYWSNDEDIENLAKNTLAYSLANKNQKGDLVELFKLLATNISNKVPDEEKRKIYGKTLFGINDLFKIENWINEHLDEIKANQDNINSLLMLLSPILLENIQNNNLKKCDNQEVMKCFLSEWISGKPYYNLLETLQQEGVKLIWGSKRRKLKIDHIIDICENGISYYGSIVIGVIAESLKIINNDTYLELEDKLLLLQKSLKYGLPSLLSINIYELGFSDRVIAQELGKIIGANSKAKTLKKLKTNFPKVLSVLTKFPSHFENVCRNLI